MSTHTGEGQAKLAPALASELRQRRRGKGGAGRRSWHVDESYLEVRGSWCYLYRAIDRNGDLVDTMLSEHRDMVAAKAFFRSARSATGIVPDKVTTDGHGSYPRAIRSTLGRRFTPRTSAYMNNRLEQDHRGIKGRIRCMRGFKSVTSADRFCRSYDELRNHLRPCTRHNRSVPASRRRMLYLRRATAALAILRQDRTTRQLACDGISGASADRIGHPPCRTRAMPTAGTGSRSSDTE